nr:hypothetical protein CFP56_76094 [Quercus suber]
MLEVEGMEGCCWDRMVWCDYGCDVRQLGAEGEGRTMTKVEEGQRVVRWTAVDRRRCWGAVVSRAVRGVNGAVNLGIFDGLKKAELIVRVETHQISLVLPRMEPTTTVQYQLLSHPAQFTFEVEENV